MAQTQRIDFIDLAKGICMIALVLGHCGISIAGNATIPLYLIISGMFFKECESPRTFITKKTNKILVPFLFFYLLGYVAFYGIKYTAPQYLITSARGILDIFDNRQFFNGPIWFLLSLYWCNIILYAIFNTTKKLSIRVFTILLTGTIGWYLGKCEFFIPLFIDVAMTSLPFFALGYYLKGSAIFNGGQKAIYAIVGILLALFSLYLPHRISLHYNIIEGFYSYLASLTIAFATMFICLCIKRIPFVNYFGKFSLIPLCVHHFIYRPVKVLLHSTGVEIIDNGYMVAGVTLLLSTLCIPLCIKYIPWFVAQKDLIKENTK